MEPENNEISQGSFSVPEENQIRIKGNVKCFFCRHMRVLPFGRCTDCNLSGADQCPTIKAAIFFLLLIAATGLAAYIIGGWASRTVFVMTGLFAIIMLLLTNSRSNERARTSARLVHLHKELAEQHDFLRLLSPLDSLEECAERIVESASIRLRCHRVSIMLPDENHEYLKIVASLGVPKDIVAETRIPIGEDISGAIFQSDKPIHVSDANVRRGSSKLLIDSKVFMSGPLLLSGMRWGNVRVGVLSVTEPIGREDFNIDDEFVFSNICEASAVAIYNRMAINQVKQANLELLETLANAIEAKDPYTRGHSERVCAYAMAMGHRLSLGKESLGHLQMASRLHDIGKIGIPDAVLHKPGSLTENEWGVIRQHSVIGAEMLLKASIVIPAIKAIRHHHEKLDGTGYPHGLSRREIPIMARIIGVADAFDAMTSERPYHSPFSVDEAIAELRRCEDEQFDPTCITAFISAIDSGILADELPGAREEPSLPQPTSTEA